MGGCSSAVAPEELAGPRANKKSWCKCCGSRSWPVLRSSPGAAPLRAWGLTGNGCTKHTTNQRADSAVVSLLNIKDGDTSERPTPEEAKTWSHNFERMLRHKYGLAVFQDFLRSQYGEENLNFWLSVEEYKTTPRENKLEMARTIYEDYVSTLSPTEISLDARIREILDKNMSEPDEDAFKPAQDHIYTLMLQDCFPRFLKSKHYKQLLKRS